MPLSALLDGQIIHSFDYSESEWNSLKQIRSKLDIKMACCNNKGILKTSSLGTYFFAHYKRGDCTSLPESKEHLLAKFIVAKAAKKSGWKVFTEYRGKTPEGEIWVADVYAEKGGAKIVFEIQLSPQTQFEMVRRQEKYKISDIRCAWFTKRRIHDFHMSDDNYDVPNFAIDLAEDKKKFIVCRFDVDLEEFVSGMLAGKLKMPGIENRIAHTGLIIGYDKCWKCHKWTNVILGLLHMDDENSENFVYSGYGCGFLKFEQISYLINSKFLTENVRIKHKIGLIKERYSRTTESSYLSNGCFHCDALMGNHFLKNLFEKICYVGRFPSPKICRKLVYGKDIPVQEYKHWTFDGKNGGGP